MATNYYKPKGSGNPVGNYFGGDNSPPPSNPLAGGSAPTPWDQPAPPRSQQISNYVNNYTNTGEASATANAAQDMAHSGLDTSPFGGPGATPPAPTPGVLSEPGYYEEYYKAHGNDLMGPSASEDLYAKGAAGSNPYYDYAEGRATDSINAASRARGGFNSGAALAQIGNSSAYLRGQQAHELGQLAGQADTAKLGRYGLTGQMADTAQSHTENRITGALDREMGLDSAQANQVHGFYADAMAAAQKGDMAAVEARLKAAGMDAAEIKQFTDLFMSGAALATKAA